MTSAARVWDLSPLPPWLPVPLFLVTQPPTATFSSCCTCFWGPVGGSQGWCRLKAYCSSEPGLAMLQSPRILPLGEEEVPDVTSLGLIGRSLKLVSRPL